MIRRITRGDRELFLRMTRMFYDSPAVLHKIPDEYHEAAFEELMRSDAYLDCYILEKDGEPAGYALLNYTYQHEAGGRVVWLEELFVLPEFRSEGLGGEFFEYAERNIPAARFRLELERDNVRAGRLYGRMGYENLPYEQMIKDLRT